MDPKERSTKLRKLCSVSLVQEISGSNVFLESFKRQPFEPAEHLCTPSLAAGWKPAAEELLLQLVLPSLGREKKDDNWPNDHPGAVSWISCSSRAALGVYKSLPHLSIFAFAAPTRLPSCPLVSPEKLRKTRKVSKEWWYFPGCGVSFFIISGWSPRHILKYTISNTPGLFLFLSASVWRLKQGPVLLLTGLKRSRTQRKPRQQALLSHPAGMSRVANRLLNWISHSVLQQEQNKRCHNYNFIPWLPASAWQQ